MCIEKARKSTSRSRTLMRSWGSDCAASRTMTASVAERISAISSATGWTTPVTLEQWVSATTFGRPRSSSRKWSRSSLPRASTRVSARRPARRHGSVCEWCASMHPTT
ncbi:hypothetical protein QA942_38440 [Streptomyces sp. B21-106]